MVCTPKAKLTDQPEWLNAWLPKLLQVNRTTRSSKYIHPDMAYILVYMYMHESIKFHIAKNKIACTRLVMLAEVKSLGE